MNIVEKQMNLFAVSKDNYLVHCISSDFALGAGIAKEFRNRGTARQLEMRYSKNWWIGHGYCLMTDIPGFKGVYNLVTKERYFNKPTYFTLEEALMNLKRELGYPGVADENGAINIAMPYIGCGLDRLQWNEVKEVIYKVLGDIENLNITVCYL